MLRYVVLYDIDNYYKMYTGLVVDDADGDEEGFEDPEVVKKRQRVRDDLNRNAREIYEKLNQKKNYK